MVRTGEIFIGTDPEIGDVYICECIRPTEQGAHTVPCRILDIIQYPQQHAIIDRMIASENPPLLPDTRARLHFTARLSGFQPERTADGRVRLISEEEHRRAMGTAYYWASFASALRQYRRETEHLIAAGHRSPEETAILDRHEKREFSGRRSCAI